MFALESANCKVSPVQTEPDEFAVKFGFNVQHDTTDTVVLLVALFDPLRVVVTVKLTFPLGSTPIFKVLL